MTSTVLVVGAGPTGLTLALSLARSGVTVRIVDARPGPTTESRALDVQARTLELYRQLGVADAVLAHGVRVEQVRVRDHGREVASVDVSAMGAGRSPYPFILCCPQDDHEAVLAAALTAAGVNVEWGTELVAVRQSADRLSAILVTPDGTRSEVEAAYLGGCDGARSTVRRELSVPFPGGSYDQDYFVADVVADGSPAPSTFSFCLSDDDFVLMVPARRNGTQRFIGLVPAGLDGRAAAPMSGTPATTFDDLRTAAERATGTRVDTVNWFSTYQVSHRVAEHFRIGRSFLLGDAGHVHSPLGGQGMNTGIADAVNLGWKLAAVLDGRAAPALLDTYEPERIRFARSLVRTTDTVFTLISGSAARHRLARQLVFRVLLPGVLRTPGLRLALAGQVSQLAVSYRASPLSSGRAGRLRGGDRLPWVVFPDGTDNFAPLADLDWQLHVYGSARPELSAWADGGGWSMRVFPWTSGTRRAGLRRNAAYLVRPDGYLAAVARRQQVRVLATTLDRRRLIPRSRSLTSTKP